MKTIWQLGEPWRIWPFATADKVLVSVATGRPNNVKKCNLFLSSDGVEFKQIADFVKENSRASTTGQPFINSGGTMLVPVWDVDYYDMGATYAAIYRSDDNGKTWTKVFEDPEGTYANHFFESPDGEHLFIGIGRHGGGKNGVVGFSPASGYLLYSNDDGRSWSTFFEFKKRSALYQGIVLDNDSIAVTTREQKSLIRASLSSRKWHEEPLGHSTRCITYIEELRRFVISTDSAILVSCDTRNWSVIKSPVTGPLRYPMFRDGLIHLACAGCRPCIVATDLKHWYMIEDFSTLTEKPVTRMAFFGDAIYNGSEFEGYFVVSLPHSRRRKLGICDMASSRIKNLLNKRNR